MSTSAVAPPSKQLVFLVFIVYKTQNTVNSILKDAWIALSEEDKSVWKKWEVWDALRYERDLQIFQKAKRKKRKQINENDASPRKVPINRSSECADILIEETKGFQALGIPKKKKLTQEIPASKDLRSGQNGDGSQITFHIPKKKRDM